MSPANSIRAIRSIRRRPRTARLTSVLTWRVAQLLAHSRIRSDRGQTTAEYGLVILAAGTLALAAILWARNSGSITQLFQSVIDQLTGNLG